MSRPFTSETTTFCVLDVGSTTTKACLFHRASGGQWTFLRRDTPTTVEKPEEDVTAGVRRAMELLVAASGLDLVRADLPAVPCLATSSAGGGLAMIVTGLMREISSRSAERVALGAGAVILDVIALDDARTPYEKITSLASQRADMILLAGGFEGDALTQPVFLAELLNEARLRPKRSPAARLPVVYAGNSHARPLVERTLTDRYLFQPVDNIRPDYSHEQPAPARQAIQDLFMDHVMSQAPGYETLRHWVSADVVPTPAAVGHIVGHASRRLNKRILTIDIGGATTDIFTAVDGQVRRSVSANLGMTYSILHVLQAVGMPALQALLHPSLTESEIWDIVGEMHLHPSRLPQTAKERAVQQGVATLAIRAAMSEHLRLLTMEPPDYDLIIGSGGVLSHSTRSVATQTLIEALEPAAGTELALDNGFIFPHLGALSTIEPDLASTLFDAFGLVQLGIVGRMAAGIRDSVPTVPGAVSVPPADATIGQGAICLRRELAVVGEVFVVPGETVRPDTIVARSTRLFLRPFFLHVSTAIGLGASDPTEFLRVGVGDALEVGQLVARRKIGLLRTKEYRSPVSGTVERLLPDGTLLVREKAEQAAEIVTVRAAKDLGLTPAATVSLLRCSVGQQVERGQLLAAAPEPGTTRRVVSPIRGRVQHIDFSTGTIRLAPLKEALEINAWLPGTVTEVSGRGCLIEASGTTASGMWGRGGEAWGILNLGGPASAGEVLVREMATREVLDEVTESGASGLIAAGGHLVELQTESTTPTVVLTQGFGQRSMDEELRRLFRDRAGQLVLIDGTIELRVGVRRPRIIFPDDAGVSSV